MKSFLPGLLFLVLFISAASAQIVDEVPRQIADAWLALVDEGKYSESWQASSPLFQKALSESDWIEKIRASRKALGKMQERKFIKGRFMRDPANLPTGEYFALEFQTEFEKSKITEMVVPMRDLTGRWQICSYLTSSQVAGEP